MLQLVASVIVVDESLTSFEVWDSKHTMLEAARKGGRTLQERELCCRIVLPQFTLLLHTTLTLWLHTGTGRIGRTGEQVVGRWLFSHPKFGF